MTLCISSIVVFDASQPLSVEIFCSDDTSTTEIYTLSLHDALPISLASARNSTCLLSGESSAAVSSTPLCVDRKSTRLNSSHGYISYAVFCLKKKKRELPLFSIHIRRIARHCEPESFTASIS